MAVKLKELGWIEGQNLVIERAFAEGREGRLPELAEMLTRRRVDVIWRLGPSSAVAAARHLPLLLAEERRRQGWLK